MKVFFDTEFTGLSKEADIISIGLVAENGKTFYAEFTDFDKEKVSIWTKTNVIENLLTKFISKNKKHPSIQEGLLYTLPVYADYLIVGTRSQVEPHLRYWFEILKGEPDNKIEMWGDCLAWDWVLFCDLFGDAISLPDSIYYIPFDICTLFKMKGIDPDISREEFCKGGVEVNCSAFWGNRPIKHNALWDAYIIRECYKNLT